jgi:hypothetical protein
VSAVDLIVVASPPVCLQSPSAGSLHDHGWSSPYRFRELYDPESDELRSSIADAPSPSPSARLAAQHAMREHMNELFFGIATNTQWQQQQVRGLFAVYKKCCLLTEDRGQYGGRMK